MSKNVKIKVYNIDEVPSDIGKSNKEYNLNFDDENYSHDEEKVNSVSDSFTQHFAMVFDKFNRISDFGKDIFYDISNVYYKNKYAKDNDSYREIIINKKD